MHAFFDALERAAAALSQSLTQWPDVVLSCALLGAAAFLVLLAITPGHQAFKATVLAYVILP
jgi:hypothetical protein